MNEKTKAIVRVIILFVTAINALFTAKGCNPIPFDETMFTEVASYILAGIAAVWTWWKNNNMTEEAEMAQGYMEELKSYRGEIGIEGEAYDPADPDEEPEDEEEDDEEA